MRGVRRNGATGRFPALLSQKAVPRSSPACALKENTVDRRKSDAATSDAVNQAFSMTDEASPGSENFKPRKSTADFDGLSEIYQGAISTIFYATCNQTGRGVVLKAYHKDRMDERHVVRLGREIEAQRTIQDKAHPHVCELIDFFEDEDDYFLVLERCDGGDVFALQHENGGSLNEAFVCTEIVVPLLKVLIHLHSHAWIHRDIKPENIFLTGQDRFKLGDFGLSINWESETPFEISGTLDYLAPEMLRNPSTELEEGRASMDDLEREGLSPYGTSVDVWAVGVIAYELVTGAAPFTRKGEPELDTMNRILQRYDINFPGSMSPQWAHFVRCALEKDPARRPDAALMLHHPWVRQHVAQRRRGVFAKPEPPRSLLCAEERRRLQRGTVVDRTGMRRNTGPRGSTPPSSPKRGAKSLLDKEVQLREAEEEELLIRGEGGEDGVQRGDVNAHKWSGGRARSEGGGDRDRGEGRGAASRRSDSSSKPQVWKAASEAWKDADEEAPAMSRAPGEQGTRLSIGRQLGDWSRTQWEPARECGGQQQLQHMGNARHQSVY
eukprot:jgi/Ulvmu1/699/UM010_0071.1